LTQRQGGKEKKKKRKKESGVKPPHSKLPARRLLHDLDLRLGQAVPLVDQPALLPVRRRDLPLQRRLVVGGFGGGNDPNASSGVQRASW